MHNEDNGGQCIDRIVLRNHFGEVQADHKLRGNASDQVWQVLQIIELRFCPEEGNVFHHKDGEQHEPNYGWHANAEESETEAIDALGNAFEQKDD